MDTYTNLTKEKGNLTTKEYYLNSKGQKVLEYGYDPYRNEDDNTLYYYWWDFIESGKGYHYFRTELKEFIEKTYGIKVGTLQALYVGTDIKKEIGTY